MKLIQRIKTLDQQRRWAETMQESYDIMSEICDLIPELIKITTETQNKLKCSRCQSIFDTHMGCLCGR